MTFKIGNTWWNNNNNNKKNSAKGPDKGKIVNKLHCILLTTLEFSDYIFFPKKTDMKFIISVSNLKEISPSVFSWKKEYIKNYDAILLSKYDSAEKRLCLRVEKWSRSV
jgi:hypothetical protein